MGSGVLDEAEHVAFGVDDRGDPAAVADLVDLLLHRAASIEHRLDARLDVVDMPERGRAGHVLGVVAVRDEADLLPLEVVAVLSGRLGAGYWVESDGGGRVTVRKSALMYANISISDQPGASVFGVHGGGFIFLRLANTFGTARRVADALRRSPEFRSL